MDNRKKNDRLIDALKDVSLAMTGSFDLDTLLQSIVETCTKFSNASRGALFLHNDEENTLVMRAEKNYAPELRFTARYSTNVDPNAKQIGLTTYIYMNNMTLVLNSPEEIINHQAHKGKYDDNHYPGKEKCQSWVGIPIIDPKAKKPIGVLKIENTIDRVPTIKFTDSEIEVFKLIANIASESIVKLQNKIGIINLSINRLSDALKGTGPLNSKLRDIVSTFKEISHADGASIWLIDSSGSKLVCKCGVGHYEGMEEVASYELNFDTKKDKKVGLTAWIAKSGEMINIKSHKALISHPQHKGNYDNKNYPGTKKCESFIGAPLRIGDKIIGVIKADNRIPISEHPEQYFTEEEAQVFSYLSLITAIVIQNDQDFEKSRIHDRQLLTLYSLSAECSSFNNLNQILWYLLTGLTHNDGIGFNRAILFDVLEDGYSVILRGKMSIGPIDSIEGALVQKRLDRREIDLDIENCKREIEKNANVPPPSKLHSFIDSLNFHIEPTCAISKLIKETEQPKLKIIKYSDLCSDLFQYLAKLDSDKINKEGFLAFSIHYSNSQSILGICDYVYSRADFSNYIINVSETFIGQITFALSRLALKRTDEEMREKAWKEFSATTAHRIGTETSDISGALHWIEQEIAKNNSNYININENISRISSASKRLKLAVNEYVALASSPALKFEQVDINALLLESIHNLSDENKRIVFAGPNADELLPRDTSGANLILFDCDLDKTLPRINADRSKLLYAFSEILHNSLKELPSGGAIAVSTKNIVDKKLVAVKFIDSGPGIKEDIIDRIFELAFKGRPHGTGLGLYIVKTTIQEHHGTIKASNALPENTGACFEIHLPITSKFIYNRVLVVDDTENLRYDVVKQIANIFQNLTIDQAANEEIALNYIFHEKYDYVITDIGLEDGGGTASGGLIVLEHVKKRNPETKVIVITSHLARGVVDSKGDFVYVLERAKELGADKCISRLDQEDCLNTIIECISN